MYLPTPSPVSNARYYQQGDVQIDPSAVIGPGVVLQAAPQSRIIIGPGVCLGMGVVLSCDQGTIEIEKGATLGSGVLIVGESKVGAFASVGALTTILNTSVEASNIVPFASLLGDTSRSLDLQALQEPQKSNPPEPIVEPEPVVVPVAEPTTPPTPPQPIPTVPIIGKLYVNQLLVTLFPEQTNNTPRQNGH